MYLKLLGVGLIYGFGFTIIKSLFPTPVILLFLTEGPTTEGNLTMLATVYMLSGLVAGIMAAPLFGAILLGRKSVPADGGPTAPAPRYATNLWLSLVLSFVFAMVIGVISGLLTMGAYATGILPQGGVLDPLTLIRSSNFSPGYPLLVAWTLARDLLPAMLAGLFLAPVGGNLLYAIYAVKRPPKNRHYERKFDDIGPEDRT